MRACHPRVITLRPRPVSSVNAVLLAGLDTDCGSYLSAQTLTSLVAAGALDPMLIDAALARLYRVQFRLGFFDRRSAVPGSMVGTEVVDTPAHRALAREAADASLVLLKNRAVAGGGQTLPLDAAAYAGRTVAVLGRNANATTNMLGNCA